MRKNIFLNKLADSIKVSLVKEVPCEVEGVLLVKDNLKKEISKLKPTNEKRASFNKAFNKIFKATKKFYEPINLSAGKKIKDAFSSVAIKNFQNGVIRNPLIKR